MMRCNFKKRKTTLKKKASQLSKLCDVDVGMVCFGPGGTAEMWPENKTEVCDIIGRYKGLCQKKDGENYNLIGFLKKKKREEKSNKKKNLDQEKKRKLGRVYSTWDERLDQFSEEELLGLCSRVDHKLQVLSERIKRQKNEKAIQILHNVDDFSPNKNNLTALPPQFNCHCFHNQPVFSGSDVDLLGSENLDRKNNENNYTSKSCNMNNYFYFGRGKEFSEALPSFADRDEAAIAVLGSVSQK